MAWALPVVLIWRESYEFGWVWLGVWLSVCSALGLLSHEPLAVRRAVIVCALAQLPLMGLEALGHPLFESAGGGVAGSLGKRYVLSALMGLASLWSVGWKAWGWMLAAALTGSIIGVAPALARLVWQARKDWRVWAGLVNALGLLLIGWLVVDRTAPVRYVTARVADRWDIWQGV